MEKKKKKGGGRGGGRVGWEETGSDSVAILTNLALLNIADDDDTRDDTPLLNFMVQVEGLTLRGDNTAFELSVPISTV